MATKIGFDNGPAVRSGDAPEWMLHDDPRVFCIDCLNKQGYRCTVFNAGTIPAGIKHHCLKFKPRFV